MYWPAPAVGEPTREALNYGRIGTRSGLVIDHDWNGRSNSDAGGFWRGDFASSEAHLPSTGRTAPHGATIVVAPDTGWPRRTERRCAQCSWPSRGNEPWRSPTSA